MDDSAVIRGLLTKTLESDAEIKVTSTVGNGQAAVDALKRTDIDVIVLDIEMPVMDGLTALPKLLEARPGVQVIMASTLTLKGASVSMKALSLGAADYLPKPTTTTGISTADDFKRDLVEKVKSWGLVARRKRGLPPGSAAAPGSNVPAPHPMSRILAGAGERSIRRITRLRLNWSQALVPSAYLAACSLSDGPGIPIPMIFCTHFQSSTKGLDALGKVIELVSELFHRRPASERLVHIKDDCLVAVNNEIDPAEIHSQPRTCLSYCGRNLDARGDR